MSIDRPAAPPEQGLVVTEKVRGMNASLTPTSEVRPLSERSRGPLKLAEKRAVIGAVLATAAVAAVGLTVKSMGAASSSYPATVTASQVYDLNFPSAGKVTEVLVAVGQPVKKGQVLARQDPTTLQSALTAAEGVLAADQAELAQAQSPQLTPAQYEQYQLQVEQAQTALSNAEANLNAAVNSGRASVGQAQVAAAQAQNQVNSDQALSAQACPNGPVPPDPSATGSVLQTEQAQFTHCQDLQLQMERDQSAAAQAASQISVAEGQANDMVTQDQAAVNSAAAALRVAQYQVTLQTSSANPTAVAQAEAVVSQAKGQVAQAQQALTEATLMAPADATVAEVFGAVGEFLGPDGVHQYSGPAALPSSGSSGFQLFPAATVPSSGSTASANQPLLQLIGGNQQVTVQVPEGSVGSLHAGGPATVSIGALHQTVNAAVTSVIQNSVHTSGPVTFDAVVTLDHPVGGLLPGMSASVRF